mmetsp:Transcript_17571/g.40491  ORF Transcript_17571/g.40491 Transcript_17571/m.40491 type:complete len:89 (-) Transcript_17571:67-333(-)
MGRRPEIGITDPGRLGEHAARMNRIQTGSKNGRRWERFLAPEFRFPLPDFGGAVVATKIKNSWFRYDRRRFLHKLFLTKSRIGLRNHF